MDRAHLLSNNIELDQRAGVLTEQIARLEEVVAQLSEQEAGSRSGLTALDEMLEAVALRLQAGAGEAGLGSSSNW